LSVSIVIFLEKKRDEESLVDAIFYRVYVDKVTLKLQTQRIHDGRQNRENEEDVGWGREKGENSCVKKTDPLHLCTHFTLKTLYKHKERKTAALTSRLCALG